MPGVLTALAHDLLLARVQHAVAEAVFSHGRSGRQCHLPKHIGGDHGVLMVAKQTLDLAS
jgi:hypothetical protein